MIVSDIDWPALAERVALELLGQPNVHLSRKHELRYGSRGAFAVNLNLGVWFDFESGDGGGVLDLVEREVGGRAAAFTWLKERGLLPGSPSVSRVLVLARAPGPAKRALGRLPSSSLPGAMWGASGLPDGSQGRQYLAGRFAWPPVDFGPALPGSVRWLVRADSPAADPDAGWYGLPRGAVGALVFAYRLAGQAEVRAVSLLALSSAAQRVLWGRTRAKIRTFGVRKGALFEARPGVPNGPVHICEGEVDAIALAVALEPRAAVYAMGGTSGARLLVVPGSSPIVLHADGGRDGRGAAELARQGLAASGRECRVVWYGRGEDPASAREVALSARAARHEKAGVAPADAQRLVWERRI